jgi:uncharacterized membrane protein (DUF4010 family)
MSRLAAEHPGQVNALAAAAIFANAVMAPRVLATLSVVNPAFGLQLAMPLIAIGFVYLAAGGLMMWRGSGGSEDGQDRLTIKNPLDLPAVLKFGALLSAVMALSKIATHFGGSSGVFALAALSGLADVDAIALTMAQHGVTEIGAGAAGLAVLIAIFSNTLMKVGIGWAVAGWGMGLRLAVTSALALAAGGLALVYLPRIPGLS